MYHKPAQFIKKNMKHYDLRNNHLIQGMVKSVFISQYGLVSHNRSKLNQ